MPAPDIAPLDVDPQALAVLQRYKLADANGKPVQTNLHIDKNGRVPSKNRPDPNHKPLGWTPRLDPKVILKFVNADKSKNRIWLDWMLDQAAGGEKAKERSETHFENLKARKIDEWRRSGYVNVSTGQTAIPPMSPKEAEAFWKKKQPGFWEMFELGDEDVLANWSGCYGFKREWPGPQGNYEKIVNAATEFQAALPKISEYNKLNAQEHQFSINPKDYDSYADLQKVLASVNHYFSAQEAYDDVDYDLIRDDEMITVLCPLTYRAAVEYGWDEWEWANRGKFEQDMRNVGGNQNAWNKLTSSVVPVVFMLKTPVPGWPTERDGDAPQRYVTLANMMTGIPTTQLKNFDPGTLKVLDEENDETRTWDSIIQMILNAAPQPEKPKAKVKAPAAPAPDLADEDEEEAKEELGKPEDELSFVKQGGLPYKDAKEAEAVAGVLQSAMADVQRWAKTFKPERLHSDFLTKRTKK